MSTAFTTVAPAETSAFAPKSKSTGERSQAAAMYQEALSNAVSAGEILVVNYEDGGENPDNPLTIKNRLNAAARALGLDGEILVRKVRNENRFEAVHRDVIPA